MKNNWKKEFKEKYSSSPHLLKFKVHTGGFVNSDYKLEDAVDYVMNEISNLLAQKDKDCQEYKDYYDRRKERDCKIAQTNYDWGRKKALKEFKKMIGEEKKWVDEVRGENKELDNSYSKISEVIQEIRAKLNQLKE